MINATLCFPIKKGKILLGNKKRGFGKDKINGFGGKVSETETHSKAAIREVYEEINIKVKDKDLRKIGVIDFVFPLKEEFNHKAHVYFIENWEGNPKETEEMTCEWFDVDKIPFDKMWDADKYWMPLILEGKKIQAYFEFNSDNNTIKKHEIKVLS